MIMCGSLQWNWTAVTAARDVDRPNMKMTGTVIFDNRLVVTLKLRRKCAEVGGWAVGRAGMSLLGQFLPRDTFATANVLCAKHFVFFTKENAMIDVKNPYLLAYRKCFIISFKNKMFDLPIPTKVIWQYLNTAFGTFGPAALNSTCGSEIGHMPSCCSKSAVHSRALLSASWQVDFVGNHSRAYTLHIILLSIMTVIALNSDSSEFLGQNHGGRLVGACK